MPLKSEPHPTTPEAYRKDRRGSSRIGRPQEWFPTVTVRMAMTADDAAYFKARMDEKLAAAKAKQ